jgi:dipeptidase E
MKASILISAFNNGFSLDFIKCVKKYYTKVGSFIMIASDFTSHDKNDKYANIFVSLFNLQGIEFNKVKVIDDRIAKDEMPKLIMEAGIIWLSGGDTLKQIAYIKEYGLIPYVQKRDGLTIGMSAGAINMARKVVLAKDINDNIPELSIYDGVGLVNINIEPHLDYASEDHFKEICDAAKVNPIYGLYDDSFIEIVDNTTTFHGKYIKFG